MMKRTVETTADGSTTLYVEELNEHYHSVKGARTESEHIFIRKGYKKCEKESLHILEIGFGTGLNALLTALEAEKEQKKVVYTTLELYPLKWEEVKALKYEDEELLKKIHTAEWGKRVEISPFFNIEKIKTDIETQLYDVLSKQSVSADVVYFDAFAPEKQPGIWTREIFQTLFRFMSEGGILTTYCAKGAVRRMMKEVGFEVERLEGPPGGKREILRATKKTV